MVVTVNRQGRIFVDESGMSFEAFRASFKALASKRAAQGVYLRADRERELRFGRARARGNATGGCGRHRSRRGANGGEIVIRPQSGARLGGPLGVSALLHASIIVAAVFARPAPPKALPPVYKVIDRRASGAPCDWPSDAGAAPAPPPTPATPPPRAETNPRDMPAPEAETHATKANGTRHTNGRKKGCAEERAAAEGWRRTNGRCGD